MLLEYMSSSHGNEYKLQSALYFHIRVLQGRQNQTIFAEETLQIIKMINTHFRDFQCKLIEHFRERIYLNTNQNIKKPRLIIKIDRM
jgi:glutathionyl-hydroquinone reductase